MATDKLYEKLESQAIKRLDKDVDSCIKGLTASLNKLTKGTHRSWQLFSAKIPIGTDKPKAIRLDILVRKTEDCLKEFLQEDYIQEEVKNYVGQVTELRSRVEALEELVNIESDT